MPDTHPDLRVDPSAPPGAAGALDRAATRLAAALRTLDADARRVEPWLGDPASAEAAARYAAHAADGPDAAIERLRALHAELLRARDAAGAAGRAYRGTEESVTASLDVR
ncbi:hypothetical protein [Pseudonocardia spirodelae]|uniref:PE domain-containing protein n=1 Tax=Pseudonocardia spirodelae TaxID=3133431 RepID=A0ABU8TC62_9PSEU